MLRKAKYVRFVKFYDRMTVHRNRFLVNKTKRFTEFQLYWYYYSTCFGQSFCPSSGVLSRISALVYLCSCDEPFATGVGWLRSILLLVANGPSQLHKMYQSRCTAKNSWWWAERLPEKCRVVITTNLELSASVGFIHKEYIRFVFLLQGMHLWFCCIPSALVIGSGNVYIPWINPCVGGITLFNKRQWVSVR